MALNHLSLIIHYSSTHLQLLLCIFLFMLMISFLLIIMVSLCRICYRSYLFNFRLRTWECSITSLILRSLLHLLAFILLRPNTFKPFWTKLRWLVPHIVLHPYSRVCNFQSLMVLQCLIHFYIVQLLLARSPSFSLNHLTVTGKLLSAFSVTLQVHYLLASSH
jgi:hypothetical protein